MCPAHVRSRVTMFGTVKHSRGKQKKKENPAIFWPNSCISYVLTCILFLSPPSPPTRHSNLFSFCVIFPFYPMLLPTPPFPSPFLFWLLCDWLALSLLQSCLPALHPFMLCAWTKTNVPPRTDLSQLTALTHAPWPPHHSTGNHPPLWMICSSPLYLDSSLFLSYAACSSLLLKMVTPQSLFTLFGMLSLAIYLFLFIYC